MTIGELETADYQMELLLKQTTMFVVGAGHLPGEFGMINLLREAGYKVSSYLSMPSMSGMSLSFDLLANAQVGFKLYF